MILFLNMSIPIMATIPLLFTICVSFVIKGSVLLFSAVFPLTYIKLKKNNWLEKYEILLFMHNI